MAAFIEAYEYLAYLWARRRWIAISVGIAAALALLVTLLLPRKYTATARLLIEAPAGSDPRAATAVSPVYLESLHTYEVFASSDHLFLEAAERFGLRSTGTPIDRLKRRVLKTSIPRSTRILEIDVTLPDAKKASDMARFLAERAVVLNRQLSEDVDRELVERAERDLAAARKAADEAERAWALSNSQETQRLAGRLETNEDLRRQLQQQLLSTEAQNPGDVRVQRQREQLAKLDRENAELGARLARSSTRSDALAAELDSTRTALRAAERRLNDTRASAGYRGERLKLIDPGIVPEQPSSPNLLLNLLAAIFAALLASTLFTTVHFTLERDRARSRRAQLRPVEVDD